MSSKVNTEKIPSEGRLLRVFAQRRQIASAARTAARIALEVGEPLPIANSAGATAAGDPDKLRGIPMLGPGIGSRVDDDAWLWLGARRRSAPSKPLRRLKPRRPAPDTAEATQQEDAL